MMTPALNTLIRKLSQDMFSRGHFTCTREDMCHLLRWTIFFWIVNAIPFAFGMAVSERTDDSCPTLRMEESRFVQRLKSLHEITGFDLTEKFLLRKGTVTEDRPSFRLGSTPLIRSTEFVFPNGLPGEYSVVAIFRLRKTTKKDRWYLWQISDQSGGTQVSIIVDGGKKVVEFSARGLLKNNLHYTFRSRDLQSLFDRQWHKLSVTVQASILSIYMDCKLIERRLTDEKDAIDAGGRTLITTRVEDGRPVDIELQQILIYCDPSIAEKETCCEMPGSTCAPVEGIEATPPSLVTSPLPRMLSQQLVRPGDACQCWGEKGEQGLPGLEGFPGIKGDKGDKGDIGEDGEPGYPGLKGDRGVAGLPGLDGIAGRKGEPGNRGLQGMDGEQGEKGTGGEHGPVGLPGKDGLKGDPGLQGPAGLRGDKGDIGLPGLPGLSIESKGLKGEPGVPGVPSEQGPAGPPGAPGADGKRAPNIASGPQSFWMFLWFSCDPSKGTTSGTGWKNIAGEREKGICPGCRGGFFVLNTGLRIPVTSPSVMWLHKHLSQKRRHLSLQVIL
ncbi:hypothetical protein SKAU_G00164910 [Synaphobranchus kaupii]|uniref:Collagen alpha-1(XVI) chain n=1 Tax=Synaphobranchus kaupii TaxID=118154 RepID=A0A9Q1FJD7_SYNKA|nr:hypothetical protein SKAU_G00164910 [Synaphobranchus kaupii]